MKAKTTKFFNQHDQKWVVIDAKDMVLGRLASRIAKILQGKNKATYTPNFFCGDKVIVINAKHIRVSGNKYQTKTYDKYSGYPSGRKEMKLKVLAEKNQAAVLRIAVKGMLPKNNPGTKMLKSLKIYLDAEHNQQAQKPQTITV